MNHINVTIKRFSLYIIGLFFLALGVSFSIQADLGVSPVSSLAYAFALASGLSVGMYDHSSKCFIYYDSSGTK